MEFFAELDIDVGIVNLQQHLSIEKLPVFCESVNTVLEHHGNTGKIYCLWGEFIINRELICDGLRFTLPECPNNLAWTITTGSHSIENKIQIYLSVARHQVDECFIESIDEFIKHFQIGIKKYFLNFKRDNNE